MMRVRTHYDDDFEEGVLVTYPKSPLVKVKLDNGREVSRNYVRVDPLDDEARKAIEDLKETLK